MGRLIDFLVGVAGSVLSRFLADEVKAWTPRIVEWSIQRAIRNLPQDQRERFDEEWRSHINETPGDLGKLLAAFGLLRASRKMSSDLAQKVSLWNERRKYIGVAAAVGVVALVAVRTKIECGPVLLTGGGTLLNGGGTLLTGGQQCRLVISDVRLRLPEWAHPISK